MISPYYHIHHSSPLFYSYFYFSLFFSIFLNSSISSPVINDLSTIIIARAAAQIPRALTNDGPIYGLMLLGQMRIWCICKTAKQLEGESMLWFQTSKNVTTSPSRSSSHSSVYLHGLFDSTGPDIIFHERYSLGNKEHFETFCIDGIVLG